MTLLQNLTKVAGYQSEIELINTRLEHLKVMATTIVDGEYKTINFIMETAPRNGALPIMVPLYRPPDMMPYLAQDEPVGAPKIVGFQRLYNDQDLGTESTLTVMITLDYDIALAVIDKMIIRLKQRKAQILKESTKIIKAG